MAGKSNEDDDRAAEIRRIVDEAPPLTEEQRTQLRWIFASAPRDAVAPSRKSAERAPQAEPQASMEGDEMLVWLKAALDAADQDADSMALIAARLVGERRLFLQREGERANRTRAACRRLICEHENAVRASKRGFDPLDDERYKVRAEALLSALYTVAETYDDFPGYLEEWRP